MANSDNLDPIPDKLLKSGDLPFKNDQYSELQERTQELEMTQKELGKYKKRIITLMRERTNELRLANEQLQQEIAERMRAENALMKTRDRLEKINETLLRLGPDHDSNLDRLAALCGELLGASYVVYNRMNGGMLCSLAQWQTPPDFASESAPDGLICSDVIRDNKDGTVLLTDLPATHYEKSDPHVRAYGLKTYFGQVVRSEGRPIGSLCVAYRDEFRPTDEDRRVLGILASAIGNEDTRMQAEEALKESQRQLANIVDLLPDATFVIDSEGKVIAWNRAIEEMMGVKAADILGKGDFEYSLAFYNQRRPILVDLVLKPNEEYETRYESLQRKGGVLSGQIYVLSCAGGKRYLFGAASALYDSRGNAIGAIESIRDVTEQKMMQEAVARAEEKYRDIFENSVAGIYQVGFDGNFLRVNAALAQILGYESPEQVLAEAGDVKRLYVRPERRYDLLRIIGEQGLVRGFEFELFKRDKSTAWVSVNVRAVRGEDGKVAYLEGTALDITDSKLIRAQLDQAKRMEAIGTLAGGIAHDFNNILTPIMGYSELSLNTIPENGQLHHNLKQILLSAGRAKELVKQILTFSRKTERQTKPVQVGSIITEALKLLRSSLPSTIYIDQEIDANAAESMTMADPTQIHQVIVNLCTNAAYAMRSAGGSLTISLVNVEIGPNDADSPKELQPGPYLKLSVTDTGHGMDEEVKSRIFDPYFTTKGPDEGTGLGLAVVYGIVKNLSAAIEVSSKLGEGTTFHIYLPRTAAVQKADTDAPGPLPQGSGLILLVDDERQIVDMLAQMLQLLGYAVVAKYSSPDALAAFRNRPESFDLIITDMTMPQMTGIDLAREILAIRTDIPIILCTGFSAELEERGTELPGIKGILMKPVSMRDLAATVSRVMVEAASKKREQP
jgi:PAS domain S-box-containing protein